MPILTDLEKDSSLSDLSHAIMVYQNTVPELTFDSAGRKKSEHSSSEINKAKEEFARKLQYELLSQSSTLNELQQNYNNLRNMAKKLIEEGKPGLAETVINSLKAQSIFRLVEESQKSDILFQRKMPELVKFFGSEQGVTIPVPKNDVWVRDFNSQNDRINEQNNNIWRLVALAFIDVSTDGIEPVIDGVDTLRQDSQIPQIYLDKIHDCFNQILDKLNSVAPPITKNDLARITAQYEGLRAQLNEKPLSPAIIKNIKDEINPLFSKVQNNKNSEKEPQEQLDVLKDKMIAENVNINKQLIKINEKMEENQKNNPKVEGTTKSHDSVQAPIVTEKTTLDFLGEKLGDTLDFLSNQHKQFTNSKTVDSIKTWQDKNPLEVLSTKLDQYSIAHRQEHKKGFVIDRFKQAQVAEALNQALITRDPLTIDLAVNNAKRVIKAEGLTHFYKTTQLEKIVSQIERIVLNKNQNREIIAHYKSQIPKEEPQVEEATELTNQGRNPSP